MNIKLRVQNLVSTYGTRNPYKLAEKLNITVMFRELGNTRGSFKSVLRRKYIFINENLSETDTKIVLAHELGHAILHSSKKLQFMLDHTKLVRVPKLENEANLFVKYLLFNNDMSDENIYDSEMSVELFNEIKYAKER